MDQSVTYLWKQHIDMLYALKLCEVQDFKFSRKLCTIYCCQFIGNLMTCLPFLCRRIMLNETLLIRIL